MAVMGRVAALFVACLTLASFSTDGAFAQSRDVREMLQRLDRMQREMSTLQKHVYRGTRPPPAAAAAGSASGGGDPRIGARLEVRLAELDRELRATTGRIEELQHAVRQLDTRLGKLVSDVDFRLGALETKVAKMAATAPAEGASSAQPTATAPAPSKKVASAPSGPKAIAPRSLGKIKKGTTVKPPRAATGATAKSAQNQTPSQQYSSAIRLMQAQKFSDAERAFRKFIERNPKHARLPNAHYWLGETFYVRRDYQRAAYTFAAGFQKFPDGRKAPDSLLKLGMSLGKLGKKKEACTAFSRLLENFPKAGATLKKRVTRQRQTNGCG